MRNPFKDNDFNRADDWFRNFQAERQAPQFDRLYRPTKQSDYLYDGLYRKNPDLQDIVDRADRCYGLGDALKCLFNLLYSSVQLKNNPDRLSPAVLPLQKMAAEALLKSDSFPELKAVCENKELPSFSAVAAAAEQMENLQDIPQIKSLADKVRLIEMLRRQTDKLCFCVEKEKNPQKRICFINRICKKQSQVNNLIKKARDEQIIASAAISEKTEHTIIKALEAAKQTSAILRAFGNGDAVGGTVETDKALLDKVRENEVLRQIALILGKYREILSDKRKNSFSYGLGEKYDIIGGNNISLCLSSDLALLGTPETEALFLQKYHEHRLKQYRKRKPSVKGDGDMIVLIDESSSTVEISSWIKAFALALLDIAVHGNKKFALIHFANSENIKTELFEKGKFSIEDILAAAEHFFGGGTDFEKPLGTALEILNNGFEKADIVMITDGQCEISAEFAKRFADEKLKNRVTMTGILLDKDGACGESLEPFCDKIYRSSEMTENLIAVDFIGRKAG